MITTTHSPQKLPPRSSLQYNHLITSSLLPTPLSFSQRWIAYFLSILIKLWLKTLRYKPTGDHIDQDGVIAFLHGEQLPLLLHRPLGRLIAPISLSRDGSLQVEVMKRFRVQSVRGSSSRGGAKALLGLYHSLKKYGGHALIAVDGPRGPYGHVHKGAAYLACRLKVPLWSCYVECAHSITLNTWDRFILPLPFSQIKIHTTRIDHSIEEDLASTQDQLMFTLKNKATLTSPLH